MKRLAALLAAFALSLTMFGCTQSQSTGTAGAVGAAGTASTAAAEQQGFAPRLDTGAEAEFSIIGGLNNFEALEAVINDFNEIYPNCTINYFTVEDYVNNVEARMLSDTSVGVFMMNNNFYKSQKLADLCVDLSQEDIDFSAIQDSALNACVSGGKLFGMPIAHLTNGLMVNKTLLETEGLSVPTNYAELKEVCAALRQKGYNPIQGFYNPIQGFTNAYEDHWDVTTLYTYLVTNMIYVQIGNSGRTEEIVASFENMESGCGEVLRPAFERLHEMAENGYISSENRDEYPDNYNETILRFFEGDVPFVATDAETFSGTKKRETKSEAYAAAPFDYGFICAPIGDEGAYAYIQNWYSFSVNKNCEQKDWALEFMRFLATEQEINTLASVKGLPSVAKNSTDERFAELYPENEEYLYTSSFFVPIWVTNAMNDVMNRIGEGELTVDEAVAEFEALLPKYKEIAQAS